MSKRQKLPQPETCCPFAPNCAHNMCVRFLHLVEGWKSDADREAAMQICRTLTMPQLEYVKRARTAEETRRITVLLAAAAAGKTTTMVAIYSVLRGVGNRIMYCLFNRDAAEDVKRKCGIQQGDVNTLDGWALSAYKAYGGISVKKRDESAYVMLWWNDREITAWILDAFLSEIDAFLTAPRLVLVEGQLREQGPEYQPTQRTRELCAFWIAKTFIAWTQSTASEEALEKPTLGEDGVHTLTYQRCRNDFSLALANEDGRRQLCGTQPSTFYTSTALGVWRRCVETRTLFSFACTTKFLQLRRHAFHATAILIDEAQDLNACQMDLFVSSQRSDAYIVGDSMQCLYAWRGARPSLLTSLSRLACDVKDDISLCESHRFGPRIAHIANHILCVKMHSRNPNGWRQYWVRGVAREQGEVVHHLTPPYTVVGRTNGGIVCEAMRILTDHPSTKIKFMGELQKVKAENNRLLNHTLSLFPHYKSTEGFAHRSQYYRNWDDFTTYCDVHELNYACEFQILSKYAGDETALREAIGLVRHAVDAGVSEAERDVLLCTVHKAKGLQWEKVQVLGDFPALLQLESVPGSGNVQFVASDDNLNCWYVAVTRAMWQILLPDQFTCLESAIRNGCPNMERVYPGAANALFLQMQQLLRQST